MRTGKVTVGDLAVVVACGMAVVLLFGAAVHVARVVATHETADSLAANGAPFEVLSFSPSLDGDYVRCVGELRNVSGRPLGVRVRMTARDASGAVVASGTRWPAGDRNVPPGGTVLMDDDTIFRHDKRMATYTLTVEDVTVW